MLNPFKKADPNPQQSNKKPEFEPAYEDHQSRWRKPQGIYVDDIDAYRRLNNRYRKAINVLQTICLVVMLSIFVGMSYLIFAGNFENVVFDDGSNLYCTVLENGSIGIAY